jgi:hypothetical protein
MLRTVIVTAAITFAAAAASAQEGVQLHAQKYLGTVHAFQHGDMTEQLNRLDERIAMLKADMGMFAGELKVQVMAELIEVLIERQYLVERTMRPMHQMMDEWMPRSTRPAPPHAVPDSEDGEPEAMCSPYI